MELPEFFGLDIGGNTLKVTEAHKRGDKIEIKGAALVKHGVNFLEDASEPSLKKIAEAIKQARDLARIRTVNCVASLPESPLFSRLLTIPKVEEDKVEETVHWELKSLIPVPLDEVNISFLEIGEKDTPSGKMVDVYVAAAPKTFTERYVQLAEIAGINLIALETESLANTRIANMVEKGADVMIADFGSQNTDLVLARNGVPVFTQSISTGADALTRAIAGDYGIDLARAEQYKRAYGVKTDQGDGKIAKSIEPILQIIVSEMSRTLAYVKQRLPDVNTSRIILTGEAALLPGLPDYLKSKLELNSEVLALPGIISSKFTIAGTEQQEPIALSVALGLAIKDA